MTSRRTPFVAAFLLAWAGGACAQDVDPADALRGQFLEALDAATQPRPPKPDSAALRGYLLYPYVEAARLRAALGRVLAGRRDFGLEARVQAFLERHADEPVARELRRAFLGYLGERKAWPQFEAAAPRVLNDTALRCHALHARLGTAAPGLREDVLALWLTHRDRPAACEPAFQWLEAPGRLAESEVEQRALYAARNRLKLPAALASLPLERRALVLFWERLRTQPERELKAFASGPPPPPPRPGDAELSEALVEAFDRVARRDSKVAAALFERLVEHPAFTAAQRNELRLSYALGLAYDLDPRAVDEFDELPEGALDPLAREWRVRAALLHGQSRQALAWIEAMPPVQRDEPRWRYFRARLLQKWHPRQAKALFEQVAREREYYGFLAAERLGQRPELRPRPLEDDLAVQAEIAAVPAMKRARELFLSERRDLAITELRHALADRAAGARAQAARLTAAWGWHVPTVQILSELQLWDDLWLRFPRPYDAEIERAAQDTGVPADWLYAVLRTESLYDPRAVSSAGALGLLQLQLPTARGVAQRAGLPAPARDDLFRPEVNVALGARYLRELQQGFRERFILTLAAYNAGPNRVPQWLPRERLDAEIWIENIPYNETRAYVQRALSSLVILGWRRNGEPTPVRPLLAPLAGVDEDES